jgi:hypothetical protein
MRKVVFSITTILGLVTVFTACNQAPPGYTAVATPWVGIAPFSCNINNSNVFGASCDYFASGAPNAIESLEFLRVSDTNFVDSTYVREALVMSYAGLMPLGQPVPFNKSTVGSLMEYQVERLSFAVPFDSTKYTRKNYASIAPLSDMSVMIAKRDTVITGFFEGTLQRIPQPLVVPFPADFTVFDNGYFSFKL